MVNKQIIKLWDNISIFTDDIKLTKKQKDFFTNYKSSRRNKILKNMLLRGYIIDAGIASFREILKLKRKEKLIKLREKSIREIMIKMGFKINYHILKILDEERRIILEVYNNPAKNKGYELIHDVIDSYSQAVLSNQYNISSLKIKDKIVIDAGSNVGEFAIYCARLGAKKVYAFEPVTETFKILEKQIEINNLKGKIIPVKMALGDKNETLKIVFEDAGDLGANIDLKSGTNSEIIKAIKLDDFIKKEKVSFIKMDVEGYEERVLRGAQKVIKRDKPILSFSAYHKSTDKKILPMVVKEIRQDYKIRLLKREEEDFYCE